MRSLSVALAASACLLSSCGADEAPRLLLHLAARDDEDPLQGASELAIELEAEPPVAVEPQPIDPSGFSIDLRLPDVEVLHRVRAELRDADGAVVSRGATPDAPLHLLTSFEVRLLLSRVGRAASVTILDQPLLEQATTLGSEWLVGLDASGQFAMLDLLAFVPVPGAAPLPLARPGARLADVGGTRTLVAGGGEGALLYDGTTNLWAVIDDGVANGALEEPVLVVGPDGAIAACGGGDDVVAWAVDGTVAWTAHLSVARSGCAAAVAGGALVVYGGGGDDGPAAEVVGLEDHAVRELVADPDARTGAGMAAAGDRVLVAGGSRGGTALSDAIWLDPGCADGCPEPTTLAAAHGPAAAIALDDESVLVGGGGSAFEIVAAAADGDPVPGPSVQAYGLLRADTGDVWWWGPDGLGVYAE